MLLSTFLRDNGFKVIVGQRKGSKTWTKAVEHGWVPGETLFEIEEAAKRGTIIQFLLSDAGQIELWPTIKPFLTAGKTLYFSHGFGITFKEQTGIIPPADIDVVLAAPKGSGTSVRRLFLQGKAIDALRSMPIKTAMDAVRALDLGLRHERTACGEPADQAAQDLDQRIRREYERYFKDGDGS